VSCRLLGPPAVDIGLERTRARATAATTPTTQPVCDLRARPGASAWLLGLLCPICGCFVGWINKTRVLVCPWSAAMSTPKVANVPRGVGTGPCPAACQWGL
jgi:hypothetical protein